MLADYAVNGSEQAFRDLVTRYIDLVYSTAVRLVDGDTHLAEDVAQKVFTDLGRLAGTLSPEVMLGGWLHRRACHVALSTMRSERRRENRERQAAEMNALNARAETSFEQIAPVLDEAINQLSAEDRTAIVLRFFENRDLRSVGAVLGSSEDAAQKRVSRALEKLRGLLARRGVTASATGLALVLGAHGVSAAPAGLALSVSSAALASVATSGSLTLTIAKLMAMTKLKVALGAIVVAGVGTTVVLEHQALTRLRGQNQALQQQVEQLTRQAAERQRRPDLNAQAGKLAQLRDQELRELKRLRDGVGALRQQTNEIANLRAENSQLRSATGEPDDPAEAEFKEQTQERANHLKQWGLSFFLYAGGHNDQFPATFEQAASAQHTESLLDFATNNFEIVYRGAVTNVPNPGETIIFREKQARRSPKGEWVRVYGIADGHVEIHTEPDGNFEAWEKQHTVAPQ